VFDTSVVADAGAEIAEEWFAATQQDWHDHKMHFIDERRTKVLPDRGCTSSDKDILITGRFGGCAEGCFDPTVDEMECRPPLHFDWGTRLVGEHEDRMTKGRLLPPPAGPLALAPRATYRAEHVPAHDGGTDTRPPLREELVVESFVSAVTVDHLSSAAGGEDPLVELHAPDPERMIEILVGSGGVTIE
jgi:hypothetical protein